MLLGDGDAHGASGTGDDLLSGLDVVGIEVGHLDLGDLGELLLSELANLIALGNSGTALELELLLDQVSRRRGLGDYSAMVTPMERAVPATIFLAASMSLALRSGILISAILVSCS